MKMEDRVKLKRLNLNVAGLNNPLKRNRVGNLLKKELVDKVCLQEMRLRKLEEKYLSEILKGHRFHAIASV